MSQLDSEPRLQGWSDDLVAQITSGAMRLPSYVEATYGASILDFR
jgi:hypothetical protein